MASDILDHISKIPLLTEEEEQELTQSYFRTKNPAIQSKLVRHNLRLVLKAAHKHDLTKNMLEDLFQEGSVGLLKGIEKYDPNRGVRFGNYVYFWIRAYILRFIINNANQVKLGTTQAQRKLYFNLAKTKAKLRAKGIELDDQELADLLHVKVEELQEMEQRLSAPAISLALPESDEDHNNDKNYLDKYRPDIVLSETESPSYLLEEKEKINKLNELLDKFSLKLHKREYDIFIYRLRGPNYRTLQQLGDSYGITKERVRQIETDLKNKIGKLLSINEL